MTATGAGDRSEEFAGYAALGVVGFATVLRLILAAGYPLVPDEMYYWVWSRHLAAGYFDHPPMLAWMIRAGTTVFGHTALGVRFVPTLCGTVAGLAVAATARRIAGAHAAVEAAITLSVLPLAAAGLVLATPDAPLLAGLAASMYWVVRAVDAEPRTRDSLRAWCWAGVCLGIAFLSKYTSILMPVAVVVAAAIHPRLRRRFAEPGPYLACLIAAAMVAPVLLWNSRHDWISFHFQLEHGLGRSAGSWWRAAWRNEGDLLGGQLGLATPILFVLFGIAAIRSLRPAVDPARWILALMSVLYFGFFAYSALRKHVEPNWPAPAYLGGVVLCASASWSDRAKRWRAAGIAMAGVLSLAVYAHAVQPVLPIPPARDPLARAFGWTEVADAVDRAARAPAASGPANVWRAGDRYQEAAAISFATAGHPEAFALNLGSRPNQYDLWPAFVARARPGDRLVLVLDETESPHDVILALTPFFESILRGELVTLHRGDEAIATRRVYTLDGWRGGWPSRR